MRKTSILFVLSLVAAVSVNAQKIKPKVLVGFNGLYSAPQGHFKDAFKYGIGGEVFGGIAWEKTYLVGTVGYRGYAEDLDVNAKTLSYVPIKLGVRQFFILKKVFVQADAGLSIVGGRINTQNVFAYDAGVGVRLAGFELGAFYEGFKLKDTDDSFKSIVGKIGYSFIF